MKGIPPEPTIGIVNGLYATTTGIGGLTMIQVVKYPSDKILDLTLTGKQGDIMKESVEYAKRIAYSLLTDEEQQQIVSNPFGLHVHTPEAATPKDGPSAGAAMTLAIYSVLSNKKICNTVIKALIPEDNLEDLEKLRRENVSPEDDNFKVYTINHINDVLEHCII